MIAYKISIINNVGEEYLYQYNNLLDRNCRFQQNQAFETRKKMYD